MKTLKLIVIKRCRKENNRVIKEMKKMRKKYLTLQNRTAASIMKKNVKVVEFIQRCAFVINHLKLMKNHLMES
jgi:hypothetical protein